MPTVDKYQKEDDKRKQAYTYFIGKGYSPQVAAGIVGNLVHESGLNTTIIGDKNLEKKAHGLAQWRGERYQRLKSKYGENWTDFNNQLEFVDWELRNTHKNAGEKLIEATSAHEAGQIFSDLYEIPKKKYHENEARRLAVERVGKDFLGEQYTENINSEPTNFAENNTFSNFGYQQTPHTRIGTGLPTIEEDIEEKNTSKKEESTSKEKEALLQRQREYQFLQDLSQGIVRQEATQEQQIQRPEVPQLDPMQEYEEISAFVEEPIMQQGGQIPTSSRGLYDYPNQPVKVPTKNGEITMKNIDYPVLAISQETGEQKIMLPNVEKYLFKDTKNVLEIPMMQQGGTPKQKKGETRGEYNARVRRYKKDVLRYELENNPNMLEGESKEDFKNREKYFELKRKRNLSPLAKMWTNFKEEQQQLPNVQKAVAEIITSPIDIAYNLSERFNINGNQDLKSDRKLREDNIDLVDSALDATLWINPWDVGLKAKSTLGMQALGKTIGEVLQENALDGVKEANNNLYQVGGIVNLFKKGINKTQEVFKEGVSKVNELKNEVFDKIDESVTGISDEYKELIPTNKTQKGSTYNIESIGISENDKKDYSSNFVYESDKDLLTSCSDKECSAFLTNRAVKEFPDVFNSVNYRGNGWTMHKQIVESGGEDLGHINTMYPETKTNNFNKTQIKNNFETIATSDKWKNHVRSNIKEGQIVSLYYPKSSHFQDAFEDTDGEFQNTHVGEVIKIGGKLYVRDNVSKKVHNRPLERILSNKEEDGTLIVGMAGLKPSSSIETQGFKINNEAPSNFKKALNSNIAIRAVKSLEKNKENFKNKFNFSEQEYKDFKKTAMALMYQESMYGIEESTQYNMTSGRSNSATGNIVDLVRGEDESIGLSNVKINNHYTKEERIINGFDNFLDGNINNEESPEFSAVLTLDVLGKNYKKLQEKLKDKNFSNKKLLDLTILVHNQGFDKIDESLEQENYDYNKFNEASYIKNVNKWKKLLEE